MANTKKSTGKRRGPKPKQPEFYIDSKQLRKELINFYETEKCSRELGEMLNKIAQGLSYNFRFINYTYRDEMVGDALVKMYAAVTNKRFNIESDYNPFSYFNAIAFNAFRNRIKKEKKDTETLRQYKEKIYEQEMLESTDGQVYVKPMSDEVDYSNE